MKKKLSITSRAMSVDDMLKSLADPDASAVTLSFTAMVTLSAPINPIDRENISVELSASGEKKAKSLPPDNDDFTYRRFRALSAVMLQDRSIDFSHDPDVLKKAVKLFKSKRSGHKLPVYTDHYVSATNFVGVVDDAYWDAEAEPFGVDQILAIDRTLDRNKDIIRGLDIDAINSASVTITFDWKKSHPDMDDQDFFDAWYRRKKVDGKLVAILPTKIKNVYETSLVYEGADPYAKSKLSAALDYVDTFEFENASGTDDNLLPDGGKVDKSDDGVNSMEKFKDLIEFVLQSFGHKIEDEIDLSNLRNELEKKLSFQSVAESQTQQIAELKDQNEKATQKLAEKEEVAKKASEIADKYVKSLRDGLTTFATQSLGEDAVVVIELANAETTTVTQLEKLVEIYRNKAEEKFPLSCPKCGEKMTRQSSAPLDPPKEDKTESKKVVNKAEALIDKYSKKNN